MAESKVAGVVLAAGGSRRFGSPRPKQLARWPSGGETLVHRACRLAVEAGLEPVLAVVGHCACEVSRALDDLAVEVVDNPDWQNGLSTSLRRGVAALPADVAGAMFLPCDQPRLDVETLLLVIDAFHNAGEQGGNRAFLPTYRGRNGAPALFGRKLFPALLMVEGDQGGRQLLEQRPELVVSVELADALPLRDADTEEELRALAEDAPSSGTEAVS